MDSPYLLHMLDSGKNVSPFDVNMAYDAGWTACTPYINVELDEVSDLVQDAIFSRSPNDARRTAIFVGGYDMHLALDMMDKAREAMVPPFEVSVFADPSGAFTTAAGMVAAAERQLRKTHNTDFQGKRMLVFGGTGPVGQAAAVLAAKAGAEAVIVGRSMNKAEHAMEICNTRFGVKLTGDAAHGDEEKQEILKNAELVFNAAAAGVQVLNAKQVASAPMLKVAVDVNAVPPPGIEGVGLKDDGEPLSGSNSGAVGIGALAVGNIKYQTQQNLLKQMCKSDEPLYLHFEQAFEWAREHVGE